MCVFLENRWFAMRFILINTKKESLRKGQSKTGRNARRHIVSQRRKWGERGHKHSSCSISIYLCADFICLGAFCLEFPSKYLNKSKIKREKWNKCNRILIIVESQLWVYGVHCISLLFCMFKFFHNKNLKERSLILVTVGKWIKGRANWVLEFGRLL